MTKMTINKVQTGFTWEELFNKAVRGDTKAEFILRTNALVEDNARPWVEKLDEMQEVKSDVETES